LLPGSTAPGAKFNIYDKDDNLLYENVNPGTYPVKEGGSPFRIVETAISGFTADKTDATISVEAGGTGTVSFKNTEDRATITPVKVWTGDELPAGVVKLICSFSAMSFSQGRNQYANGGG